VEDKLVMVPEGVSLTVEQMAEAVCFQEKYYRTTVSDGKGHVAEVKREQNIFDNEDFFKGYHALRETPTNLNTLLEQPAMARLLPDLEGKRVLDLGCGYGHNCMDFVRRGAAEVIGVDLSERMLAVAKTESAHERIRYHRISMTDIDVLEGTFDLIYSSLAFHYIEDFAALMRLISQKLAKGGVLLFSQEHPIVTATVDGGGHFNKNEAGERVSYTFSDYNRPGKRTMRWFVDGVEKYHRPMGQILTEVARAGLVIEEVCEPLPEPWALEILPTLDKEEIKSNFLIVRARLQEQEGLL
jgi:SAM-dependent methyltransferase